MPHALLTVSGSVVKGVGYGVKFTNNTNQCSVPNFDIIFLLQTSIQPPSLDYVINLIYF